MCIRDRGNTGAIAKVLLGKNVRGMKNLMDLGLGGYNKDLTAQEQYIAAYTEYVLKEINPLAHKIPAEGGRFIGEGNNQHWIGGPDASKLLDEYVFEAKRTLPSPTIPHFGTAGPKWNMPNAFNKPRLANGGMINPKYDVPSSSISFGNNSVSGYNNGGAVHHYNVGGLVINTHPGQDEKMIAQMVVDMLDSKNIIHAAKSGSQREFGSRVMNS